MAKKAAVKPATIANTEVDTVLASSPETVSESPFVDDTVSASSSGESHTSEEELQVSSENNQMSETPGSLLTSATAVSCGESEPPVGGSDTPTLPSFPVLSPLKSDGKTFRAGEEVMMSEKEAKALQMLGILGGMIE